MGKQNGFVALIGVFLPVIFAELGTGGQFWGLNDMAPSFDQEVVGDPMVIQGDGLYKDSALRDVEHLQHSSLWGHKYMGGGAGEGKQFLSPAGIFPNKQEIKTDAVLPAYCDPPNPCPSGFSTDDGCLDEFDNTAEFSRNYQASQNCLCDEDHMFTCPANHQKAADSMHNDVDEFSAALDALLDKAEIKDQHKGMVAKKFHEKKRRVKRDSIASKLTSKNKNKSFNPYLRGEKLTHVVAKKG